jgi:hypothetical protein
MCLVSLGELPFILVAAFFGGFLFAAVRFAYHYLIQSGRKGSGS